MKPRGLLSSTTIVVLLSTLLPTAAHAHQQLLASQPAEGDTLSAAPAEIRLTFAQSVEPSLARLRLVGPGGEVALGPLTVPNDQSTVMVAQVRGGLVAGAYTVHWLATGDDGHPVRGELHFVVREGASGLEPPAAAAPRDDVPRGTAVEDRAPGSESASSATADEAIGPTAPLYVAARWLNFGGIVLIIGTVSFATLLLGRLRRVVTTPAGLVAQLRRRAAVVGMAGAACLLVALPLRLFAQAAALEGAGSGSRGELFASILTRSLWGWGWGIEAAAAALAIVAFALARRSRDAGWVLGVPAALALAVTPGLSGHAAAVSTVAVVSDAVHVLSAGAWLGTLLVVMVAGLPPIFTSPTSGRATAGALLAAFSPLALSFAAALVITGVYAAWLHLSSVADLWSSAYGRTLLLKLGALAVVLAAGAFNWRRARPLLDQGDPRPLRRSAAVELAFGALVLAITAVLVATPPPAESDGIERGAEAAVLPE